MLLRLCSDTWDSHSHLGVKFHRQLEQKVWRHGRSCNDIDIDDRLTMQHPPWARCTAGRTGRTGSGCRWSRCPAHCRRHAHPRHPLPRVLDGLSLVLSNDITMFHIYYYIYAACLSRCPHNLSSSSIWAGTLINTHSPGSCYHKPVTKLSPSYQDPVLQERGHICTANAESLQMSTIAHLLRDLHHLDT